METNIAILPEVERKSGVGLPPLPTDSDALYAAYGDMVYRLAYVRLRNSSDADDVTQEVFLRCFKHRPVWNDLEHQKAWFLRAAINATKSFATSAYRRHSVPEREDIATQMPEHSDVLDALMQLKDEYRAVIHLYYYEGYKVSEIADMLHKKESTIKSWLFRARDQLKGLLKGEEF